MAFAKNYLTAWKLRASWGSIGDQSVPGSLYIPTMGATSSSGQWLHDDILDVSFSTPGLVASDITWQKIETLNLGTDMTLFGQLDHTFEWYQRTTKDMIVPMEGVGYNIGASAPSGNYGELRTRGWELQASWGHRFENGINLHLTAVVRVSAKIELNGVFQDQVSVDALALLALDLLLTFLFCDLIICQGVRPPEVSIVSATAENGRRTGNQQSAQDI